MSDEIEKPPERVLIFQLRGGPNGPHCVRSDEQSDAYDAALALWAMTRMGTIGRRFAWFGPDGTSRRYKVANKDEASREVVVTCEYIGDADIDTNRSD